MSSLLWKAYYEDDVDLFRQLLEASIANARQIGVRGGGGAGGHNVGNFSVGSPGGMSTSPTMLAKSRKSSAFGSLGLGNNGVTFTKADINWKDAHGMTILHHAASSCEETAFAFATALIEHPLIDLYVQDHENGWTALHRAFYFGNISVARMILERDVGDALGQTTGHVQQTIGLVKVKDREGHGPFDLYAATIKDRTLRPDVTDENRQDSDASDDEDGRMDADDDEENRRHQHVSYKQINGDEFYTFGSNRNVSLGFGDEDDRQYPERISLRRPEHLLRRFYREYLKQQDRTWSAHDDSYESQVRTAKTTPLEDIPWMIRTKPLIIQDVLMAKLHTAVLTTDPESNLYICGHGQGGRLGLGDEQTRYNFVCVETGALAGKKIATVALGQNHTLAISDKGEIFSWGNNGFGQLGYSLPKTSRNDEDPISTVPQQIFGPLKREVISGVAASRIHSVAFTGSSLFTFGKNEGQLGIVDSDARSLEMQVTPRKVAASLFTSSIASVSAIDKATVCLLENHDVWIFANFGYAKVTFPLEGFSNHFLKQSFLVTSYDTAPNRIVKVTSGGDTVCALSSRGEVFTLSVAQRTGNQASSTTNPTKIRGAVSQPLCIWSLKTGNMVARDVGVDADGSILLTTEEGSVWQRTKRAKIKNATASGTGEYKPKDYKFSRISGLTRVLAVRASAHGAYAAVRRDCDVTKTQIVVEDPTLWKDYLPLFALRPLATRLEQATMAAEDRPRFWQGNRKPDEMQMLRRAILESKDIENDLVDICERALTDGSVKYDAVLTTKSSDLRIPVHRFLLTGRSRVLRNGFAKLNAEGDAFAIPDLAVCDIDGEGRTVINFQGYDILSLVDLALYLYSDQIIEFWHIRNVPQMSHRYRQVRTELMKLSAKLELIRLEPAVRQMTEPQPCLDMDFEVAMRDTAFFQDTDVVVQLEDGEVRAHSLMLCSRCPFFEGLFMGRAGGRWLAGRDEEADVTVDLTHITVDTFNLVLRHLYADTGTELFDNIASANQDEFLDLVLDVLGAANELMLDRLSQICQSVIGRYVNARNVCWLLNAISPSSVHEFKHASLEYLCLSLESMLQGHHLNELDEDLLVELDEVVRQNQLACMPFAKSGRAEEDLHERHPELAALLDRNRQVKIDSIRLRSKYQDMTTFAPGSLGDDGTQSPSQKPRRGSTLAGKPEGERPLLKAKASSKDMMFAMDEEMGSQYRSPGPSPAIKPMSTPKLGPIPSESPMDDGWLDARGKTIASPSIRPQQSSTPGAMTPRTPKSPQLGGRTPSSTGVPWTATPLAGPSKTGLKDIMAQASSGRTSSLSQGIESQKAAAEKSGSSPFSLPAPKMSQKERKKMLQQQQAANAQSAARLNETQLNAGTARGSPWQTVSAQKVPSLKDVFNKDASPAPAQPAKPTQRAASTPHLTMRQTVANPKPAPSPQSKPIASPSTQHHQFPRSSVPANKPPRSPPQQNNLDFPSIAQSIRHSPAPVEPNLQLSIADIVEQERLQKELLKEAVAKRDLGEIQAEQEFAEWWEKESRRVQGYEDESVEKAKADTATKGGAKKAPRRKPRGDGAGRGRGKARGGAAAANGQGRGQGRGQSSQAQAQRG